MLRPLKELIRPYYLKWFYFRVFPERRPSYFESCWRYPRRRIHPRVRAELGEGGGGPDLLFLPMTDWHTRIQRTQHLVRTFAACGHRCFYVNPHLGREFPRPAVRRGRRAVLTLLGPRMAELHVQLPVEPVFHHRRLTRPERELVFSELAAMFQACGVRRLLQIVSFPLWLEVACRVREEFGFPIVCDCHDLLSGFRSVAGEIVAAEAELFRVSDLVVFSSRHLMTAHLGEHPWLQQKAILVRNAVDNAWVEAGARAKKPRGDRLVVGYVGALDFWFDVDAVAEAVGARPDWQFVLIGRVEDERIRRLSGLSNVKFEGEVAYNELPGHLAGFDVALIPFVRNSLTLATNPIKLYEYFSFGLPVVSARLPESEQFGRLVYLADGAGDYVPQIEAAAREQDGALREERRRIAQRETWSARAAELSEAFRGLAGW